jgi:hypothetical protein
VVWFKVPKVNVSHITYSEQKTNNLNDKHLFTKKFKMAKLLRNIAQEIRSVNYDIFATYNTILLDKDVSYIEKNRRIILFRNI